jgi:PAS domain S-box-containing protein
MHGIIDSFNIYCIPPILFLLTGVTLGVFSILKSNRQYENVLFALICCWYSLLMPVFISHHIFKGNIALLMKIERSVHVLYVYGPAILVLFAHSLVNKKNRIIEAGAFFISFLISLFVFTDYYFTGLWEFNWGYIAKGGIVLQVFGIWGMSALIYSFVLSVKKIRTDIDNHTRLKIRYIMFAIIIIGILTIGNMPALNGIDLYPPGNFAFIPILFMAWGIYRHDVIKINLYTKRRIIGTITRVFVVAVLLAVIPVCWWAIGNYSVDYIFSRTFPYGLPPLVSFVVSVFLVFLSLRVGENRKDSIMFSLLMLVYALLSIDIYLNCIITVPETGLRVSRLSHLFVVFIPPLGMHVIRLITNRQSENWLLAGNYLVSIFLLLFSQSNYYLQGMHVYSWGLFARKAVLFDLMSIISALTLAYIVTILVMAYRQSENSFYRHRFLFLLIGSASLAVLSLGGIPAMNGYDVYPPGNFIFIPSTLFAIALFRYNRNELIRLVGLFLHYGLTAAAVLTAAYIITLNKSVKILSLYSIVTLCGVLVFNLILRRLRYIITNRQINKLNIAFENLNDKLCRSRNDTEIVEYVSHSFFCDLLSRDCTVLIFKKSSNQFAGYTRNNPYSGFYYEPSAAESVAVITIAANHPLLDYITTKRSVIMPEEIEIFILHDGRAVGINDPLRTAEIILPVFFENQLSAIVLLGNKIDGSVYSVDEKRFLYQLGLNLGPHLEKTRILQNLEETLDERTKELRTSEKKYRTLLQTNNVGFFELDLARNVVSCNDVVLSFTGYTKDELIGMDSIKIIHQDYHQKLIDVYNRVLNREITIGSVEQEVIRRNGLPGFLDTTISLITNDNDEATGFRIIAIDITNRKTMEAALRESEKNYQQLMDNVDDCVFICTLDGHFKYINFAITRLLGFSHEEFMGKHFLSLTHLDYREKQLKFYQNQIEKNIETTYCEFLALTKDGEPKWVGQTVRMISNNEGEIEFYGVTRDVSIRKKAERERRDLEEAKSRFFSNISHEIRTPLTLMLGPIESVLLGDYGKEVDVDFFKNLHRNTLRLLKLVNNLLDFSKIEAGKMILRVQEGNIVQFARHYLSSIELAGKSKNITLAFNSSSDSIKLFFDPEKMDKVFMNLLSNALKFTGDGGSISISLKEDEHFCHIRVTDTGEGISENNLSSIFDRFSQADTTSTRKYEGTGIGLALVKELLELHGGSIEVESRYIEKFRDDHGSVFTFAIPKGVEHFEGRANITFTENSDLEDYIKDYRSIGFHEIEDTQMGDTPCEAGEISDDRPVSSEMHTILVVDDNEDMRNFLKLLLQKHYRVICAEDGEKGIHIARARMPDLIVSDVMMPVMNGFDMTSAIKTDSDLNTIPVILLTADTDLMNKVTGLENGADDYLHKPFNSLELLTRISSLLKNYENQKIIRRRNKDIERELEVARLLQERLLPSSMPVLSGYHGHAVYIPMDKVGGDFYDIEDRNGFLNVIIADVSGHGLPGAFLATVTKIALDNITDRMNPGKVLSRLNDVILKYTVQNNFVTAFFGSIDTATNIMRYSSAGHPSPLIYRKKNDEFFDLNAKGTILGWLNDLQLAEKTVHLESGDRVIFYTDGILESKNSENELYGEERLQKTIRGCAYMSAEKFSQELLGEIEIFTGDSNFDDDITMVVLDVL